MKRLFFLTLRVVLAAIALLALLHSFLSPPAFSKDGSTTDIVDFTVSVESEHVRIDDHIPEGFSTSNDNRYLAIWGQRETQEDLPRTRITQHAIFIVDLNSRELAAKLKVDQRVHQAWVDTEYVYYSAGTGTSLKRVAIKNPDKTQRVYLAGQLNGLQNHHKDRLVAFVKHQAGFKVVEIDREQFTFKSSNELDKTIHESVLAARHGNPVVLPNGRVRMRDRILDRDSGKIVCLLDCDSIPNLFASKSGSRSNPRFVFEHMHKQQAGFEAWARVLRVGELTDFDGKKIKSFGYGAFAASAEFPLGGQLKYERDAEEEEAKGIVQFFDLVKGDVHHKVQIDTPLDRGAQFSGLALIGDQAIVMVNDRIHFVKIEDSLKKLPEPLRIKPPVILAVDLEQPCSLNFDATTSAGTLRFDLISNAPGLTIDSKTGELRIDGPAMLAARFAELHKQIQKINQRYRAARVPKLDKTVGTFDRPGFEKATGQTLQFGCRGFAIPVSIRVAAPSGQTDRIRIIIPAYVDDMFFQDFFHSASLGHNRPPERFLPPAEAHGKNRGKLFMFKDPVRDGSQLLKPGKKVSDHNWIQYKEVFSNHSDTIYAITREGDLLGFPVDNDSGKIGQGKIISRGDWNEYLRVFGGGKGIIYAIDRQSGRLLLFEHLQKDGKESISEPKVIDFDDWRKYRFVHSEGDGLVYAIERSKPGKFFRFQGMTPNRQQTSAKPKQIGSGWSGFRTVISDGHGAIYCFYYDGSGFVYRDKIREGNETVVGRWKVADPEIGVRKYKRIFAGGKGTIYAISY